MYTCAWARARLRWGESGASVQTNVTSSNLLLLLLLHHLLFLAPACSDLTRRDLDVDRVRFISPPHAKACKRAHERARLTGDRYLGSVAALYRDASASAAHLLTRAWTMRSLIAYGKRGVFDSIPPDRGVVMATTPANYRYRVRLEKRMTRTASTWEWVTRSTTWSTIYAQESWIGWIAFRINRRLTKRRISIVVIWLENCLRNLGVVYKVGDTSNSLYILQVGRDYQLNEIIMWCKYLKMYKR